jgi:hypothetical protein
MRYFFFILITLLSCVCLQAQEQRKFRVHQGEVASKVVGHDQMYRFSTFQPGVVASVDGDTYEGLLNYNLLFREIQMINGDNDTVPIVLLARRIIIGESLFYEATPNGYLEVVFNSKNLQLGIRRVFELAKAEVGTPYPDTISPFLEVGKIAPTYREIFGSKARYNMLLTSGTENYFIDRNKRIHPAKRAVIIKLFPSHSQELHTFIKKQSINFKSESDLKILVQYCDSFQQ